MSTKESKFYEMEEVFHYAMDNVENGEKLPTVGEEEVERLSMNTAIGITSLPYTINLPCKVKRLSIIELVDSGSTHNFISPIVAKVVR